MTHNVFFWLKPGLSTDDIAAFETAAKKLPSIEVVASGSIGRQAPTAERPVTDKTWTYHLELKFASVDDHNTYQTHTEHNVFVNECKDLWEKVVVNDSEPI
ncbi:MAG: Dabb family protein [Verrucomicrobiota bacterium]